MGEERANPMLFPVEVMNRECSPEVPTTVFVHSMFEKESCLTKVVHVVPLISLSMREKLHEPSWQKTPSTTLGLLIEA